MNFDVILVDFILSLLLDALQLALLLILRFVDLLLCSFLSFNHFVSQLKHLLHQLGIFVGKLLNQNLAFFDLALKMLDQPEVVSAHAQNFLVFLTNLGFHLFDVAILELKLQITTWFA